MEKEAVIRHSAAETEPIVLNFLCSIIFQIKRDALEI